MKKKEARKWTLLITVVMRRQMQALLSLVILVYQIPAQALLPFQCESRFGSVNSTPGEFQRLILHHTFTHNQTRTSCIVKL